jgi:hypothetical protein
MSFLRQLFGREDPKAAQASRMFSQFSPEMAAEPRSSAAELASMRRDMMRAVLRKTLTRHGIPASWIGAEMLVATARGREAGMHWRLLIKHWDPRLLTHAVALQNSLVVRLLGYDPLAADWLMGISWQFALPDEAQCPPMPQAGFWTADHRRAEARRPAAVATAAGDIIEGPVRVPTPPPGSVDAKDSVRHDLDKLFAVRDAELKRHAAESGGADATRPMYLPTQPSALRPSRGRER